MCQKIVTVLTLLTVGLLTGCGGSASKSPLGSSGSPVSLTIRDTPPNGVAPLFFPTINPFSAAQADITAYKNAMASVESMTSTVINGRMSTAVGSGGAKALYTSLFPLK